MADVKRRFLTIEQVAEELNVMWRISITDVEDYISHAYETTAERIAAGELDDQENSEQ